MSHSSIACPHCGTLDLSRQVSAVVWEGRSSVAVHGRHVGYVGGMAAVGVSSSFGTVSTDLAAALSPPPSPPSRLAWFAWIGVLATFTFCLAGVLWFGHRSSVEDAAAHGRPDPTENPVAAYVVVLGPLVGLIVLLSVLLIRKLVQDHRWRRAIPDMHGVWNTAWYCGRCATVYFPQPVVPASVLSGSRVHPARFRGVVWQAGMVINQQRRHPQPATPEPALVAISPVVEGPSRRQPVPFDETE